VKGSAIPATISPAPKPPNTSTGKGPPAHFSSSRIHSPSPFQRSPLLPCKHRRNASWRLGSRSHSECSWPRGSNHAEENTFSWFCTPRTDCGHELERFCFVESVVCAVSLIHMVSRMHNKLLGFICVIECPGHYPQSSRRVFDAPLFPQSRS
jgi:hypothetical protein